MALMEQLGDQLRKLNQRKERAASTGHHGERHANPGSWAQHATLYTCLIVSHNWRDVLETWPRKRNVGHTFAFIVPTSQPYQYLPAWF